MRADEQCCAEFPYVESPAFELELKTTAYQFVFPFIIEIIKDRASNLYVSCSIESSKVREEEHIRFYGFPVRK